jgi:hypothetical protein
VRSQWPANACHNAHTYVVLLAELVVAVTAVVAWILLGTNHVEMTAKKKTQ